MSCIAIKATNGMTCNNRTKFGSYCGIHKHLYYKKLAKRTFSKYKEREEKTDSEILKLKEGLKETQKEFNSRLDSTDEKISNTIILGKTSLDSIEKRVSSLEETRLKLCNTLMKKIVKYNSKMQCIVDNNRLNGSDLPQEMKNIPFIGVCPERIMILDALELMTQISSIQDALVLIRRSFPDLHTQ